MHHPAGGIGGAGDVAHSKGSRTSEADDGDQRIDRGPPDTIGMPGDTVAALLVVITEQAAELPTVVSPQKLGRLPDDLRGQGIIEFERCSQPRFTVPVAVHKAIAAEPIEPVLHLDKQRIGPGDEASDRINPAARVELMPFEHRLLDHADLAGAE